MPPKKSELPGSPKIQELDEDKADEPSLLPMTPESKQLAADHRLAYIRVLCIGLQAVECSNGGGEQPPIPIRLLKPRPVPPFLPPADTRGSFDAEAAPEPAQCGGVAASPFHVGSHLGN